jgi:hypothetical protein
MQETTELVAVSYYNGGVGTFYQNDDEFYTSYELIQDDIIKKFRPPRLFSAGIIRLEIPEDVDPERLVLRIFLKGDPIVEKNDLIEVRTLSGEIEGTNSNEVAFVSDLFPGSSRRFQLYASDLQGPFQGSTLRAHDWIILVIEDRETQVSQRVIFEYIPVGTYTSFGAHVLFSSGINLLDVISPDVDNTAPGQIDTAGLDLSFTMSLTLGYRGYSNNSVARWFGDNFAFVFDLGIGNVGDIEKIISDINNVEQRSSFLQNQILIGAGFQLFGFFSVHLLNNFFANFPSKSGLDVEAVLIPEIGVDVATALRFSQNLYDRLFTESRIRSGNLPQKP